MRLPWKKSDNLQIDLLDDPAADDAPPAAPAPPAKSGTAARPPSRVAASSLYESADNPRTEMPEADIDELAEDIRRHGILQPIVVHAVDPDGRYRIHFGARRWRAAQRAGLSEVPVVVREGPTDPYAQVAENLKRHGLSALELARFIRRQVDGGESNAAVARRLGLDLTTVAHHLALLDLPPVLDAALKTGRCEAPRTLYELRKLHADQPERVADLVTGGDRITREAVATLRATKPPSEAATTVAISQRPDRTRQLVGRVAALCERLDAALLKLSKCGADALPADEVATMRQRVEALACRL